MSDPSDLTLLDLATAYALDAIPDSERADIEQRVAAAPPPIAEAFHAEVRAVREALAVVSTNTELEPPPMLREKILTAVRTDSNRRKHWRTALVAAAAVIAAVITAAGITLALRPAPSVSTAEQVFAAPDVHTSTAKLPSGGTATVVYSRERNAAVVLMNDVTPPGPGTVYEMWLIARDGPRAAGTMDAETVKPSTTAVLRDLGHSDALALTVEPGHGSTHPTTAPFLELPLA
ncbi:anti-sigma factor [Mycobacterium parmense]|uniref:Anti-sigma-K factor RskA n=1 Tax=Mycobacterium parmense TaxID=185642 RepID=A0A7I7YT20_9MYCO|nr:anti-sigma factor [Mycobacterium parmense]MCV7348894.1 anti-sigma factor [Mycobacterium parmense]ORW53205.1 anti-sigma factor [Mycobacterium parmense]BBZ44407.1 anti-sigma-K factor RskA [Mycobacterium parmense]